MFIELLHECAVVKAGWGRAKAIESIEEFLTQVHTVPLKNHVALLVLSFGQHVQVVARS